MENTLFWIGCSLGAYAVVLRQFFKRPAWVQRRWAVSALHLFFMVAVGALVGFVFSASMDLHGPTPRWPITAAVGGLLLGLWQLRRGFAPSEGLSKLLMEDLEWVETSFSAVLLAAVIMYALVQAFKIPSGSMEDTLRVGDHLFVNKFIYGIRIPYTEKRVFKLRDVRRGDIVVFQCPPSALSSADRDRGVQKDFIKRAIGLAGDIIEVRNKQLYVNHELQTESYTINRDPIVYPFRKIASNSAEYQQFWESGRLALSPESAALRDNFGPVTVPPGCYFVMGDNRDGSFDARFWGPLPNRLLKGKAWLVYWPLTRIKIIR